MFRFRLSYDLLVPTYIVGVVGAFLQISGGIWDVSSHIMGIVETFFTVPHLVLYSGVLLCLVASLTGVVLRRRVGSPIIESHLGALGANRLTVRKKLVPTGSPRA